MSDVVCPKCGIEGALAGIGRDRSEAAQLLVNLETALRELLQQDFEWCSRHAPREAALEAVLDQLVADGMLERVDDGD